MSKWKVLQDNYGWKNGYWTKGDVHEFAENEQPPKEHFVRLDRNDTPVTEKAPRVEGQMAGSELNTKPVETPEIKGAEPVAVKKPLGRPPTKQ